MAARRPRLMRKQDSKGPHGRSGLRRGRPKSGVCRKNSTKKAK